MLCTLSFSIFNGNNIQTCVTLEQQQLEREVQKQFSCLILRLMIHEGCNYN